MQQEINKWVDFFQGLILTRFRQSQPQAIETLTSFLIGHAFGLYHLNQLASAFCIPTFGACILLFFINLGQLKCMMVFSEPLRSAEILAFWNQHRSSEQSWRQLKSIVRLGDMRLAGRCGAYAGVAVKVLSYLLLLSVASATGQTLHRIVLSLKGDRYALFEHIEFFQLPPPL